MKDDGRDDAGGDYRSSKKTKTGVKRGGDLNDDDVKAGQCIYVCIYGGLPYGR